MAQSFTTIAILKEPQGKLKEIKQKIYSYTSCQFSYSAIIGVLLSLVEQKKLTSDLIFALISMKNNKEFEDEQSSGGKNGKKRINEQTNQSICKE